MCETTWNLKPYWASTSLTRTIDTDSIHFAHKNCGTTVVLPNQVLGADSDTVISLPQTTNVFVDGRPYLCPRPTWCNDLTLLRMVSHDNVLRRCILKTPDQPDICLNLHLLHMFYEHTPRDKIAKEAALHNQPRKTIGVHPNTAHKCGCLLISAPPPSIYAQNGSCALLVARTPQRVTAYTQWLLDPSTEQTQHLLKRVDVQHLTDQGKMSRAWIRDRMTCEVTSNNAVCRASICGAFLSNGAVLDRQTFLQADFEQPETTGSDLYVMYLNKDRRYVIWNVNTNMEWSQPMLVSHMLAHYIDHEQHKQREELEDRLRHQLREIPHINNDGTQPAYDRDLCVATAAENNENQMRHEWLMCSINAEQLLEVTLTPEEYAERARLCDESHTHQQKLLQHPESIKEHAHLKRAIVNCLTQTKLSTARVNDALTAHVMSEDGEWVSFAPTTLVFQGECPDDMTVRLCKKQTVGDVQPKPLFVPIPACVFAQCIDRDHTAETHDDEEDWDTLTEYEIICKTMTMDAPKAETEQEIDLLSESASFGLPFAEVDAGDEILSLVVETDTDPKWAPQDSPTSRK